MDWMPWVNLIVLVVVLVVVLIIVVALLRIFGMVMNLFGGGEDGMDKLPEIDFERVISNLIWKGGQQLLQDAGKEKGGLLGTIKNALGGATKPEKQAKSLLSNLDNLAGVKHENPAVPPQNIAIESLLSPVNPGGTSPAVQCSPGPASSPVSPGPGEPGQVKP